MGPAGGPMGQNMDPALRTSVRQASPISNPFAGLGPFAALWNIVAPIADVLGSSVSGLFGGSAANAATTGTTGATATPTTTGQTIASGGSTPLSGGTQAKAKEVYDYLRSKGMSDIHAKGILANIYGESGFQSGVIGDGGTSGGFFQMHGPRFDEMKRAVPDWATNWRGQIDHALARDYGPTYLSNSYGSAEEAASDFMRRFERPAESVRASRDIKHNQFIAGLGFQKGGRVPNASGGRSHPEMQVVQEMAMGGLVYTTASSHSTGFNAVMNQRKMSGGYSQQPVVVPVTIPMPVSGATGPQGAPASGSKVPAMSGTNSSAAAIDYMRRAQVGQILH